MADTVLIVDDSGLTRKMVRRHLESTGFSCKTFLEADCGEAALKVFEQQRIDLMITDINMPGMDGFELLTTLNRMPEAAHTIRIVMSSIANDAWRAKLVALRVSVVLPKPFTPDALKAALQSARLL